jgi:hypothetical protein
MGTEDFHDGLAAGTRSAYTKAIKRLARFGLQIGLVHNGWLLPPSELDLMFWVSQLAHVEGLSPGYIGTLLSGVQNSFLEWGCPSPMKDQHGQPLMGLHRVMRGIKRKLTKPRRTRLPITTVVLKRLMRRLTRGRAGKLGTDHACYRAMLSLGVYALLRQGEMTSTSTKSWDPMRQAAVSSITFEYNDDGSYAAMVFRCVASKCDIFRETVDIVVHATGTDDCPVLAMVEYLATRPKVLGVDTPLFVHQDGTYVTRGRLVSAMQQLLTECGYSQTSYSTHSLRIGGCCSLAAAGFGREVIAVYGRWKSDSLLRYLQLGRATLQQASKGMAHITQLQLDRRGHTGLRR